MLIVTDTSGNAALNINNNGWATFRPVGTDGLAYNFRDTTGSFTKFSINTSFGAVGINTSAFTSQAADPALAIITNATTQIGLRISPVNSSQTADYFQIQNASGTNLDRFDVNGYLGIGTGTSTLLGTADLRALSGTLPVASISGRTSFASLLVDNSLGDLITASNSGFTRFRVRNHGAFNVTGEDLDSSGTVNSIDATVTATSGLGSGTTFRTYAAAPSASSLSLFGNYNNIEYSTTYSANWTGDLIANLNQVNWRGTGNSSTGRLIGSTGKVVTYSGAGTVENSIGLMSEATFDGGTVTNAYGARIYNPTGTSTVTNAYGVYINSVTKGSTLNYALYSAGATNYFGGQVGIGIATPTTGVALDARALSGTTPVASISGSTSFAGLLVDNSGTGDLFTASKSGAPKFTILNNGNISWAGQSAFQNIFMTSATAARTYTFPDATGTVCLSGQTCSTSGIVGYWQRVSNALVPANISDDLLLGNISTASARFAVLNIAGGTPTASLSAGTAGGAYLTATGVLATTANQQLLIGNSTTGDVVLAPGGTSALTVNAFGSGTIGLDLSVSRFLGIGTSASSGTQARLQTVNASTVGFDITGSNSQTANLLNLNPNFGNTQTWFDESGHLRIGGSAPDTGKLNVTGAYTGKALTIFDETGNQDIFTASKSGVTKFTILSTGNLSWAGAGSFLNTLSANTTAAQTYTFPDATGTICLSGQTCSTSGIVGYWQRVSNAIVPANITDDLLIGGIASSSATFHVYGKAAFQGTNPVASIAANTAFAGLVVDNSGRGDIFTASSSGLNRFVIKNNGTVQLDNVNYPSCSSLSTTSNGLLTCGTISPGVSTTNGTSGAAAAGTVTTTSSSYANMSTNSSVSFTKQSSTSKLLVIVTTSAFDDITANTVIGIGVNINSTDYDCTSFDFNNTLVHHSMSCSIVVSSIPAGAQTAQMRWKRVSGTGNIDQDTADYNSITVTELENGTDSSLFQLTSGSIIQKNTTEDLLIGGVSSSSARFHVFGSAAFAGTTAVASVSALTSFAGLVVDNRGTGDLFTASSSGLNRFVITQNGNVGIGTTLPSKHLEISGTGDQLARISSTDDNDAGIEFLRSGNGFVDWRIVDSGGFLYFRSSSDDLSSITSRMLVSNTGRVGIGIGATTPDGTLEINGVDGITPIASIAGTTSFASMVVDNSGLGDLFTASSSGTSRFVITQNGNVGINKAIPTATLQVTQHDRHTPGFVFNSATCSDILNDPTSFQVYASDTNSYFSFSDCIRQFNVVGASSFFGTGAMNVRSQADNGTVLSVIGNSPSATADLFQVYGGYDSFTGVYAKRLAINGLGTNPTASLSANTASAALLVDNTGRGDLFTASSSGLTRFVVRQNGSVDIGTATGSGRLKIVPLTDDTTLQDGLQVADHSQSGYFFADYKSIGTTVPYAIIGSWSDSLNAHQNLILGGGGKVGAGTTSPGFRVDIQDSQSATAAAQIWNTNANTGGATGSCASGCHTGLIVRMGAAGSTTAPGAPDRFIDFMNGAGTVVGKVRGNNTTTGVSYDTTGGDFAEYFKKADSFEDIPYGALVCSAPNGVTKCNNLYTDIIGVASDVAGFVGRTDYENDPSYILVGLVGQIPTYLSAENGNIHAGDYLTWSSTPGYAAKQKGAGYVIGKALVNYDGTMPNQRNDIAVQPSWHDPDIYLTSTGNINVFEKTGAPAVDNTSLFGVKNSSGQEVNRVGVFSNAVVANLKSGSIDVQKLSLAGQDITGKLDQTASQTAVLNSSVSSLNGRVASLEAELSSLSSLNSQLLSFSASTGAQLSLDKLDINDASINTLAVLGRTLLNDVGITGKITAGVLTIRGLDNDGQASINTIGDLKLQDQGTGGINILNGKIIVDAKGDVNITGTVTAKTVNTTKLNIVEDTTSTTSATLSASAGSITINAGQTTLDVDTTALTANSLIFVTPDQPVLIGATKKDADTFTIKLQSPATSNIKVNWWIVN